MRKLKVALTLLFAMCFSLFLFACGGNKSGVKSVTAEGAKTTYAETDQASAFTTEGLVVKVIYKEDMKKDDNGNVIPVELKADEYTVDSSAIQWGTVGTYVVKVTPNGQKENDPSLTQEVYGTYEVNIEHAYGAADETGTKKCSVCGAQMTNLTVDDEIETSGWGSVAVIDKKIDKSPLKLVNQRTTYGTVGIGQRITVRGTAQATVLTSDWFTPLLGIANGTKGVMPRNDNWAMSGPDFTWPDHSSGAAPLGTASADSTLWDIFGSGTNCVIADYTNEAQVEFTWNYREDGIVQIIYNNISAGKKNTYEVRVPAATYEAVLYGENAKMHITELEIERNLSIQDFEVLSGPSKLAYAENTMFDETGISTKATYNKGIESVITTYDLYADIGNVTYDLRTTPLTANMTNFRLEFSGYSESLAINVTPSVIKNVQADWWIENDNDSFFHADDATYVYDVNANKEITLFASGTASKLTAELKEAAEDLGGDITGYDYYISFRLLGSGKDVKSQITVAGDTVLGLGQWNSKGGYGEVVVLVKEGADHKIAPFTLTLKEITTAEDNEADPPVVEVTADRVIKVDTSALALPAVSSVQSGTAYIDAGGEFTVVYEGELLKGEDNIKDFTFYGGTGRRSYEQMNKLNTDPNTTEVVTMAGVMKVTQFTHDSTNGTLTVKYVLLAPNLTNAFTSNSVNVDVEKSDGTVLASETLMYTYAMSDDSDLQNGYVKLGDNAYAKVDGARLILVSFNNDVDVKNNTTNNIKLNVQNDTATMFDLSVKALTGNGAEFVEANDLTKEKASARVSILGTVGDDSDYDRGAALIAVVDVTTLGIRATTATKDNDYYFELPGGSVVAGYTLGKVEGNAITFINEVIPSGDPAGTRPGDCLVGELSYYEYLETGFYYGQLGGGVGDGNHSWSNGVCTKCGSRQYAETTKNMDIAAFSEDIISRGLTLSFDVKNATADWTSAVLTTKENDSITLPNFDPWASTSGHRYPSGDDFHNGATWDSFLNCEAHVEITISISGGLIYYKNGVKMIEYKPTDSNLGDNDAVVGTVGPVIETMLTSIKEQGFTFATGANVGEVKNLTLYTAALTYGQITDLNLARRNATPVDSATFGTEAMNGYDTDDYTVTQRLVKGSTIELFGTQESAAENQWNSITVQLTNGAIVRTDMYIDTTYANKTLEQNEEPAWNGTIDGDNYIESMKALLAGGVSYIVTASWSADDLITVDIKLHNDTDSYGQTYVLKLTTGNTLPSDGFEVKILNNYNYGTVTHMIYTAPTAE